MKRRVFLKASFGSIKSKLQAGQRQKHYLGPWWDIGRNQKFPIRLTMFSIDFLTYLGLSRIKELESSWHVEWDSIFSHLHEGISILKWNNEFSYYELPSHGTMKQAAVKIKPWRHVPGCRQAHLAAASEGLRGEGYGGNVFDTRWKTQMCFVHLNRCFLTSQLISRHSTAAAVSKQNLEKPRADVCTGPQSMQIWWCNDVTRTATLDTSK